MAQPASDYVPQTDNLGASRKMRTVRRDDGADTVQEYLNADSEPFLATYTISVTVAVSTATANSHLLEIMAGSSLRVGIRYITVTQMANGTTQQNLWELVRLTTAGTGGTAYTPAPDDTADVAAGATAMTLPGAGTKGTEATIMGAWAVLTHATAATPGLNPILDRHWTLARTKGLWIPAGTSNGIALKNVTASTSTTVHITAGIVEASWT
jgi:hypothetical protein